jgi:hypothetical protein
MTPDPAAVIAAHVAAARERWRPELPKEGKYGQPTTRSSAPRANQASSNSGRAPDAGPSTTEKKPSPGHQRDTRPATDPGEASPSPQARFDAVGLPRGLMPFSAMHLYPDG